MAMDVAELAEHLRARARERADPEGRMLVAIAGAPGSGKSTIAEALAEALGAGAQVVPMDGFHLDNDRLRRRGLLARKGAPDTFDAAGLAALLGRIRAGGAVPYPTFDRAADATVPGGGTLGAEARIVIVEGNYLLMRSPPWAALQGLFDVTVWLDVPEETLHERLVARWLLHGLSPEAAEKRAVENDLRNARTAIAESGAADIVLKGGDVQKQV